MDDAAYRGKLKIGVFSKNSGCYRNIKFVITTMVKKYKLEKVVIEETDEGILIRSAIENTNFQKAIEKLRKNKAAIYKRIESQANDPETIDYYAKRANNFSDVDLDILELSTQLPGNTCLTASAAMT